MLRTHHPERQSHRGDRTKRQRRVAGRISPSSLLAVDRAEGEPTHGEKHDAGPNPIELGCRVLVATLWNMSPRRPCRKRDERNIDEEGRPPGDAVDEEAADNRTEKRGGGRSTRPQPERAALLFTSEIGGDERQPPRNEQRSGGTLENPEEDGQPHARREAAKTRSHA